MDNYMLRRRGDEYDSDVDDYDDDDDDLWGNNESYYYYLCSVLF